MAGGPRSAKESEEEELLTALQAFHLHCPVLIEETLMQSSSGETGEALRRPLLASDLLISHRPVAIARGGNRICFLARVAEGSGPVLLPAPRQAGRSRGADCLLPLACRRELVHYDPVGSGCAVASDGRARALGRRE